MTTFAELKTRVSKRLMDPSNTAVSSADVGTLINDAIDYWKQRTFWFNQTSTTSTLTVGDATLPIPVDFLYEIPNGGFVINYSNSHYPLIKVQPNEYELQNVNGNGMPYIYTFKDGEHQCYFLPNQAYSIIINYVKDYSALSADGDTNDFTTYATQMIMYEALARGMMEFRQDDKMSAYYDNAAKSEAANLFQRSNKYAGTGRLTVNCF